MSKSNPIQVFYHNINRLTVGNNYDQEFSPEQLVAFTDYCRATSITRLVVTFALVVLVPLVAVFSFIGWPVDNISQGLTGRNLFQLLQSSILCAQCGVMFSVRYRNLIPNSILKPQHHFIPSMVFVLSAVSLIFVVESTYVYPIPFACVACGILALISLVPAYVYLEAKNFTKVKKGLKTFVVTAMGSFAVLVAHELLGVLYTSQKHNPLAQSGVALLLALLKFILRVFYSWALQSYNEMATGSAIFEVKFFNMLYTSIFTQQTTNSLVLASLLAADAIENLYFLWKLNNLGKLYRKNSGKMARIVLFQTEYVALLQFLEVATPVLYILYLILIRHHPNIVFIKGINQLSETELYESLGNLALLAGFEFICLISSAAILKFRYNLSLFYQIGFYLSQNKMLVLSLMDLWAIVAFLGPYTHFGNDYSFQFDSVSFQVQIR